MDFGTKGLPQTAHRFLPLSWKISASSGLSCGKTARRNHLQQTEKRAVEGTHEPLVDGQTFDAIQKNLQDKAFNLAPKSQSTENILKGKVICGCCGGKMQRKRGTNHADWYFFTCNTNNRLGTGRCTGMYVREEDVFSAIYYQLKLYLKDRAICFWEHERKTKELNEAIAQAEQLYDAAMENSMRHFEKFVMGEIDRDEFGIARAVSQEELEKLKAAQAELEEYFQNYHRRVQMRKVYDKDLPLVDIMDEINIITVEAGRKVVVQWKQRCTRGYKRYKETSGLIGWKNHIFHSIFT